jgi:hypothetical protein
MVSPGTLDAQLRQRAIQYNAHSWTDQVPRSETLSLNYPNVTGSQNMLSTLRQLQYQEAYLRSQESAWGCGDQGEKLRANLSSGGPLCKCRLSNSSCQKQSAQLRKWGQSSQLVSEATMICSRFAEGANQNAKRYISMDKERESRSRGLLLAVNCFFVSSSLK